MAILSGRTASEVAGMLRFAAANGSSTGALSMLDEASLAFCRHPGVQPAQQAFSSARIGYQCGQVAWPAVADTAIALATVLELLGSARVPEGFNE